MRLRELRIRNFRKIEHLVVAFPKGLSVIVGENNTGKTAITPVFMSHFAVLPD